MSEIDEQIAEIDENLIRNELSVLERGEQLARRKRLYEAKYPHTKKGSAQALGSNKKQGHNVTADSAVTFVADTAAKTIQSPRTIAEDVQIANNIPEPIRDKIRDTPLADNKCELLLLARQDADAQAAIVDRICVRTIACPYSATAPLCVSSSDYERP